MIKLKCVSFSFLLVWLLSFSFGQALVKAADGKFVNISTRALVGTGEEAMIGGFVIKDGVRQVLIQAIGPELADRGITNALADPVLTLTNNTDPDNPIEIMVNDNWEDSQGQLVSDLWGGSPSLTEGSLSSAAIITLDPGSYTAKAEGKGGTAGVAIVEVYGIGSPDGSGASDPGNYTAITTGGHINELMIVDGESDPGNYTAMVEGTDGNSGVAIAEVYGIDSPGAGGKFANISTRALVGAGEEAMIGGFIIEEGPRQVLIQAIGPELTDRGISNALADPVLTITNTTDPDNPIEIGVNDDWEDSQGQWVSDLWGGSPNLMAGSLSSAAVLTLGPGKYAAMVEGKDGTTGVALVEVYGIDSPGAGSPDHEALMALYNAMDGANWTRSDNWGTTAPLDQWYGVGIDENGRVIELDLSNNQLSGPIPAALGNLTNLQYLWLFENQLSGPIPATLGNLGNLEWLWLSRNQLSGPIPAALGNLTSLQYLILSGNQLSGPIPVELGNLTSLQDLNLSENLLNGQIPAALGDLANLQNLWLFKNQLSGPIPAALGNLPNLQSLWLSDNQLSGPIPAELGDLTNLKYLWIFGNQLSGQIPAELGNLASLQYLSLSENLFTGPIPTELGNLASLQYLWLSRNQLSGQIPTEFGDLASLQNLNLSNNQLSGQIPAALGDLASMQNLNLSNNQLSGPMPAALGNLASLKDLWLSKNQLSGPIPAALGNLTNLQYLHLSGNQLSGPIPAALGNLASLQYLSLSDNQLSGPIPAELGNLGNLEWLWLSNNSLLSGPLPLNLTDIPVVLFWYNNTGLCVPVNVQFQAWLTSIVFHDGTGEDCASP